jgi:YD repeat-containing protein
VQRSAKYLSATGMVVEDPNPIWLLSEERFCRTGAATAAGGCEIAGDEQVTRYEYGSTTGVNNLLLRGVVRDATGLSLRTCYGYDRYGNRISETTPNANLSTCL